VPLLGLAPEFSGVEATTVIVSGLARQAFRQAIIIYQGRVPAVFGTIKTRREVAHIGCREVPHIGRWEVGCRGASREMPRRGTRWEASRTAARGEVARIAGCRDLIRSRDQ
jgi:hypothetical protein